MSDGKVSLLLGQTVFFMDQDRYLTRLVQIDECYRLQMQSRSTAKRVSEIY
jgi:hypothetical protein